MKILHVINNFSGGGAEKLVAEISVLQKNYGNNLMIVAINNDGEVYFDFLNRNGIAIECLGNKKYSFYSIFKLRRIIKRFKPDIIHSHLFPAQYLTVLSSCGLGIPLVTTEHSSTNSRHKNKIFYMLEFLFYSQYKRIIAISNGVESIYKKYLPSLESRIIKIENGINLELFCDVDENKNYLGFGDDSIIITMIARFGEQKDQCTLIRSLIHLPDNYHLCFVGDGSFIEKAKALVVELNVVNRVHFYGFRLDIPQIIAASDIIALSSFWEGFGLSIVEGMAAGKPVIASNVTGVREIVENAGILFPVGDEFNFACKVLELQDEQFYLETAHNCKAVSLKYDIKQTAVNYLCVYDEVVQSKGN